MWHVGHLRFIAVRVVPLIVAEAVGFFPIFPQTQQTGTPQAEQTTSVRCLPQSEHGGFLLRF